MTLLATLARLEAASTGQAQPLSRVRHRHLSAQPLVLIPLALADDPATPVAAMAGTSRTAPRLLVVPQPRDRQLRLRFLDGLARVVLDYIAAWQVTTEVLPATRTREERRRYADAPQVLVPNRAARDYLGLLGRATRFQPTDGPYAVDPSVPVLGRWLTFLADRAEYPGPALLADLTTLLAAQWATGQSPLEDAHLAAQLAWIDPPAGMTGLQAALAAEDPLRCPPAGPATDPGFDRAILEPLVRNHDRALRDRDEPAAARAAAEITEAVQGQLDPTWQSAWDGVALLNALGETAGAGRRWADDRDSFTRFSSYLADGGLPQPRRDHAVNVAAWLDRLERAQAAYDAQRALEDPFLLAELRTAGEAFGGTVVCAEPARTTASAAGRRILRPRFTVRTPDLVRVEPGRLLICPARPAQRVQITELARDGEDTATVVLEVTHGMGTPGKPRAGAVPAIGEQVTYTLDPGYFAQREFPPPSQTPWTHGGPPQQTPPQEPRRGGQRMTEPRPFDPAAETDRVIAAVLAAMAGPGRRGIIVDSPPGAGKSTLVVRAAAELVAGGETCVIVAQTNNQVDDLAARLAGHSPRLRIGRLSATDYAASPGLLATPSVSAATSVDDLPGADVILATAAKWATVRDRRWTWAIVDEAYQMRSDMLLLIADRFDRAVFIGDPGQLDPFSVIETTRWVGLPWDPMQSAVAVVLAHNPDLPVHRLPVSWRLPASAAGIVSEAFYPFTGFRAATGPGARKLNFTTAGMRSREDATLETAARSGWALHELPARHVTRTDGEIGPPR
jgi:hypothetical protein